MKTLLRTAAIAVASTALVAGGASAATAAPGDTVKVTNIKLKSTATYYKTSNPLSGIVIAVAPGANAYGFKATVKVNGAVVATKVPVYLGNTGGIYYDRKWGAGVVSLTNFTASGNDASGYFTDRPIPAPANSVRVRYAVESNSGIKITKRGKKLTFKLTATYRDKSERRLSPKRGVIQVKKGGKWRTLKTVKLNSKGKGTYKKSDRKKRSYRMLVKTTTGLQGGYSRSVKI